MVAIDTNLAFALCGAAPLRRAAALLRCLAPRLSAPADPDDVRTRRDFVREMIARNPGSISSDVDVQAMMLGYPGHFR
jgi:hypothetical protein